MASDPLPPEDQAKLDAWVASIRNLARQHGVAHRSEIGRAVKDVNLIRSKPVTFHHCMNSSITLAAGAGIPVDELIAVRTLIFG